VKYVYYIGLFVVLVGLSCQPPVLPTPPGGGEGEDEPILTQLFIPLTADPSTLAFRTNDSTFRGKTLFRLSTTSLATSTWSFQARISKQGGQILPGYGIIFSYQDTANYMAVLLNQEKHFCVVKVKGGVEESPRPVEWQLSNSIQPLGNNTVKGMYLGTGQFRIHINGLLQAEFMVDPAEISTWNKGRLGFLTVVSLEETFPTYPVKTYFQAQEPMNWDFSFPLMTYFSRSLGQQ